MTSIIDNFKVLIKENKTEKCIEDLVRDGKYFTMDFFTDLSCIAAFHGNTEVLNEICKLSKNNFYDLEEGDIFGVEAAAIRGKQYGILDKLYTGDNEWSDTVLYEIIDSNNVDVIEYFVDKGFESPNFMARMAAAMGNKDIVVKLIKLGANNFNKIISCAVEDGYKDLSDFIKNTYLK